MSQMPPISSGGLQPHRGTTVLVLGIVSLFVCGIILGPIAWVMGNADLKAMAEGRMDRSGEGNTKAGKICGMIATILHGLFLVLWLGLMILGVVGAAAGAAAGGGAGTP